MCGVRVKLHTVCIMESADMSCKFNDGYLHTKAEAKDARQTAEGTLIPVTGDKVIAKL